MPLPEARRQGWRGVCLVAITYVYFLIFAQFAFLSRLAELGIADADLKLVMAAMAAGGIALSLLTPRVRVLQSPAARLRMGLLLCAAAALFSLASLTVVVAMLVALLIGAGLGILTVTLVTHLPQWLSARHPLLDVGLGTGLGYCACNVPWLFTATPQHQALTSAALCVVGCFIANDAPISQLSVRPAATVSLPRAVLSFTALIWFDSAAFYIIQHVPALKAGTWQGTVHLWTNGALHLAAALLCVWLLRRRGVSSVLSLAVLALAGACVLLLGPQRVVLASVLYPVGVSLYSVALVAYPSLLSQAATVDERGRRAGWIYAIAGWMGSAMGIGMAQHLGHVPLLFIAVAGGVVLWPQVISMVAARGRELAAVASVLLLAFAVWRPLPHAATPATASAAVQRGRQVYIGEGCIHCHSQYVRPGTEDVVMWGPAQSLDALRQQHPPLIGNRRQGPDLSEVGTRRSALWMRAHFEHPAEVSHASFMPSYAYLFSDARGTDLIAYLQSLQGGDVAQHLAMEQEWLPAVAYSTQQGSARGPELFAQHCATCHSSDGLTRRRWSSAFHRLPPDLFNGPWQHIPANADAAQRAESLARIIKFGLHGTDMPGHEYLPDTDVVSLSTWLAQTMSRPGLTPPLSLNQGDSQ